MRLKSLELQGFKSFPDKTVLQFDEGATVIVGPNGSGKSNITDAMRWVLGELSSKNIRGSKMEDVIFIGTEVRKPMSYAEVSVTFDNSSEEGRLNSPYDTITVTRRYYRAGESEYLINRNPVRLRDIYELFMNTGVGREGYSIIGQGRIAEIISKKSEDRRNIFEEAAGIAKYRYKKEEAERKLKQTQDNMDRAYDIFNELALRVGPLEKEAEKAKKYAELYERKKVADVSLWIYDSQKMRQDIEKLTSDLKISAHELEMIDESLKQIEAQENALYEKAQEIDKEDRRVYSEISSCRNTLSELNSELKVMETNAKHAQLSSNEQIEELERMQAKKQVCINEIAEKEKAYEQVNNRLKEANEILESLKNQLEDIESKRTAIAEELERLFKLQKDLEQEKNDITVRLSVLENSQSSGDERIDEINQDINKYREQLDELTKKAEDKAKILAEYEEQTNKLQASLDEINAEFEEKSARYDELKDEMNILKSKQLALKERINALTSMEELFEGYSRSVGFVMNAYRNNEIKGAKTVYGPVSTLISVSEEYITAIETALGAGLQHIVVDDENTAKACINSLKENKAGRATFYPVSSVSPQQPTVEMQNAQSYKGYIGVADSLIKFDKKFKDIFSSLLGRTVIFDNLENATEMAKEQKYRVRVVTLDGQQISVGGSFTGGSVKHEGSMLSRTSDIKRMEEEEKEISAKLDLIKKEGQALAERLRELTSKRSAQKQQFDLYDTLYRAEKTEYDSIVAQIKINKDLIEGLESDTKRLSDEDEKNKSEVVALKEKKDQIDIQIDEISAKRIDLDIEKGEKDEQIETISNEINNYMIKIAEIKKDVEIAVAAILDANSKLEEIDKEISDKNDKMKLYNEAVSSVEEKTTINRELYQKAEQRLESLEKEREMLADSRTANEEKRNNLSKKNKEITSKKEIVLRSHTQGESKLEQLNVEYDKMVAKLYDDYGLTYSTAVALGYPLVDATNRKEVAQTAIECKNKIRNLGGVNPNAIEEYKEVKERYDYMNAQISDLNNSREDLLKIINDLETEMKKSFVEAFNAINENFNSVFKELFGGGHAELSLTDENDVLNCGIEIKAAPPGKVIKSLMLLSGGEQAFVAIALLFAILKVNPTPFCVFDEIEAALDDVNVNRFGQYIKRYSKQTQFIIITHRRGTMEIADRLYGVTMPQKGISKVLTMDVNDVGKDRILSTTNNAK
ncbi:MAG: chromosome segregation protein SMC [Clostridia bacterium]|nr:chromosome segregation protein SMC [Clostridia bacterium]